MKAALHTLKAGWKSFLKTISALPTWSLNVVLLVCSLVCAIYFYRHGRNLSAVLHSCMVGWNLSAALYSRWLDLYREANRQLIKYNQKLVGHIDTFSDIVDAVRPEPEMKNRLPEDFKL